MWFETADALAPYKPRYCVDKYGIPSLRNRIVRNFLAGPAGALVMCDDDVIPPAAFVEELLKVEGFDILAGVVMVAPDSVFLSNAWTKTADGKWTMTERDSGLPEPVDVVGTGCILIHRRVLEDSDMARPFSIVESDDGVREVGDDVAFCLRAGELGYRIGMHWGIVCEHVIDGLYATEIRAAYEGALLPDESITR